MNAREDIIRQLQEIAPYSLKGITGDKAAEIVADFIIADRKRIVEPLVKLKECYITNHETKEAIDETKKRAGLNS